MDKFLIPILLFLFLLSAKNTTAQCNIFEDACYGSPTGFSCNSTIDMPCGGKYLIPIKIHYHPDILDDLLLPIESNLNIKIGQVNTIFNVANVPLEFHIKEFVSNSPNNLFIDGCGIELNSCVPNYSTNWNDFDDSDQLSINIFVVSSFIFCNNSPMEYSRKGHGVTFLPFGNIELDGIVVGIEAEAAIIAHEIGHLLGLHHTFETCSDNFSSCNSGLSGTYGDGIVDTPFDLDGTSNTQTGNLMDYNFFANTIPPPFNQTSITTCQKAKMLDVLYECQNDFCDDNTEVYLDNPNYFRRKMCIGEPNPIFVALDECHEWYEYTGNPSQPTNGPPLYVGQEFQPQATYPAGTHLFYLKSQKFAYNPDCGIIIKLIVEEPTSDFCTGNYGFEPHDDFDLEDPCSCEDPLNVLEDNGLVRYFHDILTITNAPRFEPVFVSNDVNFIDANGNPINGQIGVTDANGELVFDFYHPVGVAATLDVTITTVTKPFVSSVCFQCTTGGGTPVPTLGEWGLMILTLLLLIIGVTAIKQHAIFSYS